MKWLAIPAGAILLLLVGALSVFLATPVGSRLIAIQASSFINVQTDSSLLIEEVSGSLAGTLCAVTVVYQLPGLLVQIDNACANLNLWSSIDFFRVDLASVTAESVTIETSQVPGVKPEPTEIRELALPIPISADSLKVTKLLVNGLQFDSIQTRLALENENLSVAGRVNHAGLELEISTSGPWADFAIELSGSDLNANARLNLIDPQLPFSVDATAQALDLSPWTDRQLLLGNLVTSANGNLDQIQLKLQTKVADEQVGSATLDLTGVGDPIGMAISGALKDFDSNQLDLVIAATTLEGRIDWAPLNYTAQIDSSGVRTGINEYQSAGNGTLTINGDQDQVELSGELNSVEVAHSGFAGMLDPAAAAELRVNGPTVLLTSSIRWSPALRYDVAFSAVDLQISLDGRTLSSSGDWQIGGTTDLLEVTARQVNGYLDDVPLSAEFDLQRSVAGVLNLNQAQLQLGSGSLLADGQYTPDGTVELIASSEDFPLAHVYPRLQGTLSGKLRASGTTADPAVAANLKAADFAFDSYTAQQIDLSLDGRLHQGQLTLAVGREDLEARTELAYRWKDDALRLEIASFDGAIQDPQAGSIQGSLSAPASAHFADGRFDLSHTCLRLAVETLAQEATEICGSISWPEGPLLLTAPAVTLPELPLLDGDLIIAGRLSADIAMTSLQPLAGSGSVKFSKLNARDTREETNQPLGDVALDLQVGEQQLAVSFITPQAQSLQLNGELTGRLADPLMQSELAGELSASLEGIWIIESLLPMDITYALEDVTGQVALAAEVSGSIEQPLVNGTVTFKDAGWHVPATGVTVADVNMAARLHDSDRLTLETTGTAGGGEFSLSGELSSPAQDSRVLTARFETAPAHLVNLPDYSAWLAGNLVLEMEDDALQFSGEVEMPTAFIKINEVPETAHVVSDDAVIHGEEFQTPAQQIRTTTLNLRLGDDVRLQAFGLDTFLEGQLQLIEKPGKPPELLGTINLREGIFEAYGQALEINRGALTFSGPMQDPSVDVAATRTVTYRGRDYLITLQINGTALALDTVVRSTPALPESDVLALLITGRTFSEVSTSEQNNVYGAAIAMGLFGMTGISGNVASQLNLEEIIVDQDSEGNMNVGAAIRLNRDLYLRYTYSALSRLGGVLLRYRLNQRFSVQAQTGDTQSIEIRYGVDN